MPLETDDPKQAARLLQWGLRSQARPAQSAEYRELVERYLDKPDFRELVRKIAEGLDLAVLEVSEHGIVLSPNGDSVFALAPSQLYPTMGGAEDRLLNGLIMIGIAAAVYPRAQDLEEDLTLARRPITVDEVDDLLRELCAKLAEEARGKPDPVAAESMAGLYEAWRIYQKHAAAKETTGSHRPRNTTRRHIGRALDRLCEFGCFVRESEGSNGRYQPTWRYQVQIQQIAATAVFERVRQALDSRAAT